MVGTIDFLSDFPGQRIVGLDLTGSVKKASGFAVLEDGQATTMRLKSDEDILDQISLAKPVLVSIDCPLSLPYERLSVFDDDPGRHEFGILRQCERDLLRRGIRCYPPLLKSMQLLTQRGISLAKKISTLGYPVIETFPGGVQDALGLPRKQHNLNQLIQGLKAIGIGIGNLDQARISHDEIDAVTCALAGLYYLKGRFERVGNDDEGSIVIPLPEMRATLKALL